MMRLYFRLKHRQLASVITFPKLCAGTYSLQIRPVTLEDDGRFQCQVSPGKDGSAPIRSRYATLAVHIPPEPPQIVQGSHLITTEDREVELECHSRGGKPAAEV